MERLPIVTLLLCLAAACGTPSKQPASDHPAGRIITLSSAILDTGGKDTVRFGRMKSGETAVKYLVLHNVTGRPLTIASYGRTCGCTTLDYENQPLAPGEKRPMTLVFDSRGERGWQFKMLEISFAGCRRPLKLYVEAEVE